MLDGIKKGCAKEGGHNVSAKATKVRMVFVTLCL